jgi:hypothetical protein
MAPPTLPPRAPAARPPPARAPSARRLAPALAALGLAAALPHAACGDDPPLRSFLGAGGAAPPSGSFYGPPFVPRPPGAAGSGGEAGAPPTAVLRAAAAIRCVAETLDFDAPALSAVGSLGFHEGSVEASFGGVGHQITPSGACLALGPAGAGGAAGDAGAAGAAGDAGAAGAAGAGGGARAGDPNDPGGIIKAGGLPTPVFAWATLADQRRVAVTDRAVELLPAGGGPPIASCDLPALGDPGRARRRAAFDPSDPLHVWIVDGGPTLYERRLVDGDAPGCAAPGPDRDVGGVALRDVAADAKAGQIWLAVVATNGLDGSLAQVWRATPAGGAIGDDLRWPERSGGCSAGGLLSANAVATLPDGDGDGVSDGVAVADGACGSVVRFRFVDDDNDPNNSPRFTPLDRTTLPAGDPPRALASDPEGRLFIASSIERLPGSRVGFWRAPPP